ncbi:LTA synthase family protein [Thioalbus denitrificans]|uniref:Phosphoglycerol transferase MdoB-like AlkP superfamily enzyme n=1 Tax=Thioalbus denitrificans TaxID=547122 RepID=A0A369CC08_9GAMM|nr:LTA synthase family protein [Thioalbus denitrificans]RCX30266.1 phosphoglycerol transferase MdoB-like AlkP superfamily enzyme [Thioalbus denitrificans]
MSRLRSALGSLLPKLLPVASTAIFYAIYYLVSALQFDVSIAYRAVPYDFLLQLLVAYALFALSRRKWVFVVLQGLLMAVLYVGNAVKISFFGGPIMPDDVYALRSLLLILEGWQFLAAALPLAMITALLLFNFTLRHWSAYLASMVLILLGVTLVYKPAAILEPLDRRFGNSVWDQRSNYLYRGATLYSLQEGARYFADADEPPDRDAALAAANRLLGDDPQAAAADDGFTPRNVHIVLLESFWDPTLLAKADYSRDPLTPEFRRLWQRSGHAEAMSPVFGGYTANAEFEILCGFPVVKDSVKFERRLLNDAPCLPHLLAERGYRTIASHPNVPVFWNRVNAYRRLGFQTYWSIQDFRRDDMNREFLSDASLYRQVLEKIAAPLEAGQPVLDYIVTYFGHWNYPLSVSRPGLITSPSRVEEVSTYANAVYYKSRELMEFLDALQKRDPDGIIVVFGDHLPYMGENFSGYVDSGVLASKRSDFTAEMFRFYASTPMIVIDGPRGPVRTGDLPIYEVPALLLGLLGYDEPTIMDYTRAPEGMRVRPLPGLHYDLLDDGRVEVCKEPPFTPACERSSRWLRDVLTVNDDLFVGGQHTRQ